MWAAAALVVAALLTPTVPTVDVGAPSSANALPEDALYTAVTAPNVLDGVSTTGTLLSPTPASPTPPTSPSPPTDPTPPTPPPDPPAAPSADAPPAPNPPGPAVTLPAPMPSGGTHEAPDANGTKAATDTLQDLLAPSVDPPAAADDAQAAADAPAGPAAADEAAPAPLAPAPTPATAASPGARASLAQVTLDRGSLDPTAPLMGIIVVTSGILATAGILAVVMLRRF